MKKISFLVFTSGIFTCLFSSELAVRSNPIVSDKTISGFLTATHMGVREWEFLVTGDLNGHLIKVKGFRREKGGKITESYQRELATNKILSICDFPKISYEKSDSDSFAERKVRLSFSNSGAFLDSKITGDKSSPVCVMVVGEWDESGVLKKIDFSSICKTSLTPDFRNGLNSMMYFYDSTRIIQNKNVFSLITLNDTDNSSEIIVFLEFFNQSVD